MEVKVHDKVSLSESNPGTILRSIEDESITIRIMFKALTKVSN